MGDKKVVVIVVISIMILLGIVGGTYKVIATMNEDKKELDATQEKINKEYEEFKAQADKFTDSRKVYQTTVVENLYIESVEEEYEIWMQSFANYKATVDAILEETKEIHGLCVGKEYPDSEVMTNCSSYMTNHETVMNYFVKDVDSFNEFMEDYYKDYQGDREKTPPYEIDTTVYKYVDINDDGIFIGQE